MEYSELKTGITTHLNAAAEDFFLVGYFLRQISEKALFLEDGYKNIWDFAKGEYNLSTSSASRFMAINARFSIDGGEHMAQKYIGMGVSKLQEMLGLPEEELEKVTKETTVREIRAMKAAAKKPAPVLSFYEMEATVYPEGSLLTTPGCGHKHNCFTCTRQCQIRQEECNCMTAPLGNPRGCQNMDPERWKYMEASLYKSECLFLHQDDLAKKATGTEEPTPCCRDCKYKATCYSSCDVAKEEHKKEMDRQRRAYEKEQEHKRLEEEAKRAAREAEKNAADQSKKVKAELKELEAMEDDFIKDFYTNHLYSSEKAIIKNRQRAEITKLLKTEHGSTYMSAMLKNNGWVSCYPDKIQFTRQGFEGKLQITWGRFTTKLIKLLDLYPELEKFEEPKKEADIIDAVFVEIEEEPAEEPEQLPAEAEQEEAKAEQESQEPDQNPDGTWNGKDGRAPEAYDAADVKTLLAAAKSEIKTYKECGAPSRMIRKQTILKDALELLLVQMEAAE